MEKAYQEEDLRIRIKFLIIRTIITSLSVLIALAKIILSGLDKPSKVTEAVSLSVFIIGSILIITILAKRRNLTLSGWIYIFFLNFLTVFFSFYYEPYQCIPSFFTLIMNPMSIVFFFIHDQKQCVQAIILNEFILCLYAYIFFAYHMEAYDGLSLTKEQFKQLIFSVGSRIIIQVATVIIEILLNAKRREILFKLNNELKKETKARETFFASLSHELRNPLNSLLGSLEIISNNTKSKTNPEILQSAKACGETLLNLIGNILDFAKASAGKLEILPSAVDLRSKIKNTCLMFKNLAEKKGLFLNYISDPLFPPALEVDFNKLNQVLINLIGNSIKFTSKGGIYVKLSWIEHREEEPSLEMIRNELDSALCYSSKEELFHQCDEELEDSVSNHLRTHYFASPVELNLSRRFHTTRRVSHHQMHKRELKSFRNEVRHRASYDENVSSSRLSRIKEEEKSEEGNNCNIFPASRRIKNGSYNVNKQIQKGLRRHGIVKVEVIDTGIGISHQNQSKLFLPFAQAGQTTNTTFGGTGLGLWISKTIVHFMGGNLIIDSEEDQGTNFICGIPVIEAEEQKAIIKDDNSWIESKNYFKKKNIIYVEDQLENQQIMNEVLKYLGFKIHSGHNGKEGFQIYSTNPDFYDLIITDLRMPLMSGQEMILKIRNYETIQKVKRNIPIIVLSGDSHENERNLCLHSLGANDFLSKPINFNEFTNSVKQSIFPHIRSQNIGKKGDEKKLILLIDDDAFASSIVKQYNSQVLNIFLYCKLMISKMFYYIYIYIYQGMKKFKEAYKSLFAVIMDNELPDGKGNEAIHTMQEYEKENKISQRVTQIYYISISGHDVNTQRKSYNGLIIHKFLQKPLSKGSIVETVDDLKLTL